MRLTLLVHLVLVVCAAPPHAPAQVPGENANGSAYTVGTAYPTISSTFDIRPQIQVLPSDPTPRIVPVHPTPPLDGPGARGPFWLPEIKQYGSFDGLGQHGWIPPDCALAVGPGHVLATINQHIAWWTREGELQFSIPLNDSGSPGFFEDVGARGFTFDPKCLYDEHAGRFFVLALETYTDEAWITFAVSDDDDPNGIWYKYRTDAVTWSGNKSYWLDYPGLGTDSQAFYVTANLFGLNHSGFGGAKYRIIPKTDILDGNPVTYLDLRDSGAASVQVASTHGPWAVPYFVSVASSTAIRVQAITDPTTSPALATDTVAVASFGSPPSVPTLGGSNIDSLDGRIMNASFRDGFLHAAHAVGLTGRTKARWYEIETNGWPRYGALDRTQQGTVDLGSGVHSFFPAIERNAAGDIVMVMARGGEAEYPSVWYGRHRAGDPTNSMNERREFKAGESGYQDWRWGDYFDIALDPLDDLSFWGVGEYAISTHSFGTWIGLLGFTPATLSYIEPGCPGSAGIIPLLDTVAPEIGQPLDLSITQSIGGVPFYVISGLSQSDVFFGGCHLHVGWPWFMYGPFVMGGLPVPGYGQIDLSFALPNDPIFVGITLYAQAVILDPGAPRGVSATRAAALGFGDLPAGS